MKGTAAVWLWYGWGGRLKYSGSTVEYGKRHVKVRYKYGNFFWRLLCVKFLQEVKNFVP